MNSESLNLRFDLILQKIKHTKLIWLQIYLDLEFYLLSRKHIQINRKLNHFKIGSQIRNRFQIRFNLLEQADQMALINFDCLKFSDV